MSADFQFYQTYGTTPGTDQPQGLGQSTNDWSFKANNTPGPYSGDADEQIRAGDYSYHVYIKGEFTQPASGVGFSSIYNVKYYGSLINLSGYGDGAEIYASGTDTYATPSNTAKSGVWDPLPRYSASGIDIGTPALSGGNPGFTKWVALQLKTGANNATSGLGNDQYFTLVYDEV